MSSDVLRHLHKILYVDYGYTYKLRHQYQNGVVVNNCKTPGQALRVPGA
jgi:hypothetical protein